MATIKISQLNSIETLNDNALFLIVQDNASRQLRFDNLITQINDQLRSNFQIEVINNNIGTLQTSNTNLTISASTNKNNIQNNANHISTLSTTYADDSNYGLIKLSSDLQDNTTKLYGLQKDSNGHAYVNVPWEQYTLAGDNVNGVIRLSTGLCDSVNGNYGLKINSNGNAYVNVPNIIADDNQYGQIKLCSDLNDNVNKFYGLRKDTDGHAYVYVPWETGGGGGGNYDDIINRLSGNQRAISNDVSAISGNCSNCSSTILSIQDNVVLPLTDTTRNLSTTTYSLSTQMKTTFTKFYNNLTDIAEIQPDATQESLLSSLSALIHSYRELITEFYGSLSDS